MAHNTVKLNGVIDENPFPGSPTYIPGGYSPTPLINIGAFYSISDSDTLLVDCLYTIHAPAAYLSEASYVSRYIITYRVDGTSVIWDSQQQLFEYVDCNGVYTPPNHLFLANTWSDGIVLLPDPTYPGGLIIGRVMYDINIILQ
jgi:hypothetical protein